MPVCRRGSSPGLQRPAHQLGGAKRATQNVGRFNDQSGAGEEENDGGRSPPPTGRPDVTADLSAVFTEEGLTSTLFPTLTLEPLLKRGERRG